MNISPPAPRGNINGLTVYLIDLMIGRASKPHSVMNESIPKQPNRNGPSRAQHPTVHRCSGALHGIKGARRSSTAARVTENNITW
mmetsp:Transcript_10075/g.18883  ORF Transcript_10075/g.18883 Transcript_10075/m.18883 type:complete len:85 (-) Transcript_10075:406-660(-)